MDLHVMRATDSENHIFSFWSVCVSVCVSLCLLSAELKNELQKNHQIWYSVFVSHTDINFL